MSSPRGSEVNRVFLGKQSGRRRPFAAQQQRVEKERMTRALGCLSMIHFPLDQEFLLLLSPHHCPSIAPASAISLDTSARSVSDPRHLRTLRIP